MEASHAKREPRAPAAMPPTLSEERRAPVGELELAYQTIGEPGDAPLLLVMGLGAQLIFWPDRFCELLADDGFFVVRYDNRDCGHSTVLDSLGTPSLMEALTRGLDAAPYTLSEMAGDGMGLLDHLGIDAAHVVGASLGGMIAQTMAIEHPDRMLSLASIMSTTGARSVGDATAEAREVLMTRPPLHDRGAFVESAAAARAVIGSRGLERDEAWTREIAGRSFDRGIHPEGTLRQLAAVVASGDRTDALRGVDVPTVVIHGTDDPLISITGGEATAAAVRGAALVRIDGMGHDLPPASWGPIVEAIAANAARAGVPYGLDAPAT
jgi:pimeloyl-ACP methyl ester carboxylesterase